MASVRKCFGILKPKHYFLISKKSIISETFTSTTTSTEQDRELTIIEQHGGIKTVTLNNPAKRNALSLRMLLTLLGNLQSTNKDLRVVILKATGNVFSSGHDLSELTTEQGSEYHKKVFSTCTQVMSLISSLPVPVIAQVSGLATAAGCQLVASCDIAVAAQSAKFATPGVNVGLFCSTPAVAVARSLPNKVAMEMLLTGHPISAQDALKHGLVSKVVADEDLEMETMAIAEKICSTSRSVVEMGKACFYSQITVDTDAAYRLAEKTMVDNLRLEDGKEGIDAFIKKRNPVWAHK